MTRTLAMLALSGAAFAAYGSAQNLVITDPAGDAVIRRTDTGNNGVIPSAAVLPDLIEARFEGWMPNDPADPYTGSVVNGNPDIFRIKLTFKGLVCPPGSLGLLGGSYDPFSFGQSPVFGYLDIDMDENENTGGDLGDSGIDKYLANIGRFGTRPSSDLAPRAARSGDQIDSDFFTQPYYERSGADFSLVLCGCFTPTIELEGGDADGCFEAGETWVVSGRFFERSRGYADASAAFGGSDFGNYDPIVSLQFSHSTQDDTTTVTLVYAITMEGAAILTCEPEQPIDLDVTNHTSLEEAFQDIIDGASFPSGPAAILTDGWRHASPGDAFEIRDWVPTVIFGTAYSNPEDSLFVWTDTGFGEQFGDIGGDGDVNACDRNDFNDEIVLLDGTSDDLDGIVNDAVILPNFGSSFHMYDFDSNGVIDDNDRAVVEPCVADITTVNSPPASPGYGKPDGQITAADLQHYVNLWVTPDTKADVTTTNAQQGAPDYGKPDGSVTSSDLQFFVNAWITGCP